MGTVSVASLNKILAQVNASAPSAWFDDDFSVGYKEKQTKIHEVRVDVFAHMLAAIDAGIPLWEIGSNWKHAIETDPELKMLKLVPLQDHYISRARDIRRYYRNRLTIQSLKNGEMSKFRKDLFDFLNMPVTSVRIDYLPMMLRLPDFYLEDVTLDDLAKNYKEPTRSPEYSSTLISNSARTLNFVVKTHRKTKNQTSAKHYWFSDAEGYLHRLAIEDTNKLRHIFERHLDAPLQIEARFPIYNLKGRDFSFYSIEGDWKLL